MRASWLLLTIPLFFVFLWLLIRVALHLLRSTRASVVAAGPLRDIVQLTLNEPGEYALFGEGKRFSRDFGGLEFSIRDHTGDAIPVHGVLARTVVSSFDRVRLHLRSFSLASPGEITIRVGGLRQGSDPENRIVIARPMMGTLVASVLGLVALGALTLASLGGSIAIAVLAFR